MRKNKTYQIFHVRPVVLKFKKCKEKKCQTYGRCLAFSTTEILKIAKILIAV